MEVQLHFYSTLSGYKGDEVAFIHPTHIPLLPKQGEHFNYDDELFERMAVKEKQQFTQRKFAVGEYYVAGIKDWRSEDIDLDYVIFLIKDSTL